MKTPSSIGAPASAANSPPVAQRDVVKMAKQIETVFLSEFLKAMFEQTSFAKNRTVSTFLPVITGQIADSLADRGLGFSDLLLKNYPVRQELPAAPVQEPAKR